MESSSFIILERDLAFALSRTDDEGQAIAACADSLALVFRSCGVAVKSGSDLEIRGRLAIIAGRAVGDESAVFDESCRVHRFPISDRASETGVVCLVVPVSECFTAEAGCSVARCAGIIGVALKRIRAVGIVAAAAEDRELLEKEYRHRTRNTFQLIQNTVSFMLSCVQGDNALTPKEIDLRFNAIAALYEQLNCTGNDTSVRLDEYFRQLTDLLRRVTAGSQAHLVCDIEALGQATLPIDRAATIGLILNELIMNSFKHHAAVRMRVVVALKTGGLALDYSDEALPPADQLAEPKTEYRSGDSGLGLRLIDALLQRAGGWRSDDGACAHRFQAFFAIAPEG